MTVEPRAEPLRATLDGPVAQRGADDEADTGGADASGRVAGAAVGPSGGQTGVARPLAARCSTIGGGRSDFGDLVIGGERPSGCTGGRDACVREAVRLRAASDPRVRRGGAGASAPRGVSGSLRGAGQARLSPWLRGAHARGHHPGAGQMRAKLLQGRACLLPRVRSGVAP